METCKARCSHSCACLRCWQGLPSVGVWDVQQHFYSRSCVIDLAMGMDGREGAWVLGQPDENFGRTLEPLMYRYLHTWTECQKCKNHMHMKFESSSAGFFTPSCMCCLCKQQWTQIYSTELPALACTKACQRCASLSSDNKKRALCKRLLHGQQLGSNLKLA